ncbi:MAG: hypothetical protein DDT21_01830 [Syntrophomonadaceae bacterium]|nr:hypothetical protein [Bacillota bacterium]
MAKTEKRYNKEFKDGVVRLVLDNGRSGASVAKDLGISEQTVYRWLDQQKTRQRPDKVRIIELEAELKAANRRVVDLEKTVTILKKATAIFATPPQK